MKIEWKNSELFKQHKEEMDSFRRTHPSLTPSESAKPDRVIPNITTSITPYHPDSANFLTNEKGYVIVVPLWDISLPKDSQN